MIKLVQTYATASLIIKPDSNVNFLKLILKSQLTTYLHISFDLNPCLYRLRYGCVGMPQIFTVEPEKSQKSTMLLIMPQHFKIGRENVRVSM